MPMSSEPKRSGMPVVTLTTGLRVGNLGSPHAFAFTDGSVLPAAAHDRVEATKLTTSEQLYEQRIAGGDAEPIVFQNVALEFMMNAGTADTLIAAWRLWESKKVDIVLVPLPCLLAMKRCVEPVQSGTRYREVRNPFPFDPLDWSDHPFRAIRVADRTTKAIHVDKFCV
jgi:hypothetical protein